MAVDMRQVGPYWDPRIETMPRETILQFQGERLRHQVRYVYQNSAFYKYWYDKHQFHPDDVRGLEDIHKIPPMEKDDLRDYREEHGDLWGGVLCVPESDLVWINRSTGTSGKPNVYGLTQNDLDHSSDTFARFLYQIGLRKGDQMAFNGGMAWHGVLSGLKDGMAKLGVTTYPLADNVMMLMQAMFEQAPEASYDVLFTYLPEIEIPYLQQNNIKANEFHKRVRFLMSMALITDVRRDLVEAAWGGIPFKNLTGSGDQYLVGGECEYSKPAHHMPEDQFICEVLDFETRKQKAPGEYGELVITNLWAEGFPFIRYLLEDAVEYDPSVCKCGRTHARVHWKGRLAWSVLVGDRRIFTDEVEEVIWRHPAMQTGQYQLEKIHKKQQDSLIVNCVKTDPDYDDAKLTAELQDKLTATFGVHSTVNLVGIDAIANLGAKYERLKKSF